MVLNLHVTQDILLSHYTKPVAKGNGNNPFYCCRHALFPVFEFFKNNNTARLVYLHIGVTDYFLMKNKSSLSS